MCSVCDPKGYALIHGVHSDFLQKELFGSLVMRCRTDGTHFSMLHAEHETHEYRVYFCPTCGRFLWKGQ